MITWETACKIALRNCSYIAEGRGQHTSDFGYSLGCMEGSRSHDSTPTPRMTSLVKEEKAREFQKHHF